MSDFDIAKFANFEPPKYLCPRCLGIDKAEDDFWGNIPKSWHSYNTSPPGSYICNICNIKYVPNKDFNNIHDYLERWNCVIEYENLTERFTTLAKVASNFNMDSSARLRIFRKPALFCLYEILNQAQNFVHFTTWGLSWDFIGMLALLSHRVAVKGIVSSCDDKKTKQIKESIKYGGNGFEIIPIPVNESPFKPHQKLIVIDGLIAITGSANLTINAWDNIDKGLEHIVIETRPDKVLDLNNTLFSPVWKYFHPVPNDEIPMKLIGRSWKESFRDS
jgi:hypothetical protein